MIVDTIDRLSAYRGIAPTLDRAIDWLCRHDLETAFHTPPVLEQVELRPVATETRPFAQRMEYHKNHIDLHIVLAGEEEVVFAPYEAAAEDLEGDEADDCFLVAATPHLRFAAASGMFYIFLPGELHMPLLSSHAPVSMKKLVVKCDLSGERRS